MTKGEYYHARDNYSRQYRRLGRCLFLAETEEEDARYWRLYKSNLENWRRLQVPESMPTPTPLLRKNFYRPVFNEEYAMYTRQLKQLYEQREKLPRNTRTSLDAEIKRIKKLRRNCTDYVDRATGALRPKDKPPSTQPSGKIRKRLGQNGPNLSE